MDQTDDDSSSEAGAARDGGTDRVGEEFRLLLDALAYRAEEFLHGLGGEDGFGTSGNDGLGGAGAERTSTACPAPCPLCAAMSLLRGERPELTTRVFDHLEGLVALLRRILIEYQGGSVDDGGTTAGANAADEDADAERAEGEDPSETPKVQRIDVRRVRGNLFQYDQDQEIDLEERVEGLGC